MSSAAWGADEVHGHVHEHAEHHEMNFVRKYIFSTDHKIIGIQFLFSSLIFLLLGGGLAMVLRWQLAWPDRPVPILSRWWEAYAYQMPPEFYTMLLTMHGTIMIFFVIIPVLLGAFGNFTIPLMIGARDMAFPRLNMCSYWFMWPAFILILASFAVEGGAAASGWTSYPPVASVPSAAPGSGAAQALARAGLANLNMGQPSLLWTGQSLWLLALLFVGISSMMGSINYMTTIINLRAPGMHFFRLPMTVWALFITAMLQAFALPVLTAALLMQLADRLIGTGFFVPAGWDVGNVAMSGGGQTLLWQHLFWFYSHPAVYIMILPAMGIVSDVIATNARKPLFGYRPMVYAIASIAGLGFMVWAHHMFVSGMNPALGMAFMVSTMMIALPSAVKTFNWLGTLWGARIRFSTAMLNALAFVSLFVIGGLSGIYMAATPVDIHIHDTYFIVAHLHYVLFGGSIFGIFAGIYHWFPKMFGRMLNETLGKIHFVGTFIAGNCTFYAMHVLGLGGLPRRYFAFTTPDSYLFEKFQGLNQFITLSALVLGLVQLIFIFNFFYSLFFGPRADRNPWQSNTLEWTATSPAPHGNWGPEVPTVYRGPYEYSSPEVKEDYLPQNQKPQTGAGGQGGHV